MSAATGSMDVVDELGAWLGAHWDPDLTARAWWGRLADAGWSGPTLPAALGGRGLSIEAANRITGHLMGAGVVGPPAGIGPMLAVPTIAAHGTPAQQSRYVRATLDGSLSWCQLFSEPEAGSDLAAAQTRAVRDGSEWVVTGQKVWTSGAQAADRGLLLARTDPAAPKHHGLGYFLLDMDQPGVTIRPLREMTGRALFNEVFLDEVRVHDDDRIGDANGGWSVARATLEFERRALGGPSGGRAIGRAVAGSRSADQDRRVGDLVAPNEMTPTGDVLTQRLLAAAHGMGPAARQDLVRLVGLARIKDLLVARLKSGSIDPVCCGSILKLHAATLAKGSAALAASVAGPRATIDGPDAEPFADIAEAVVWAPSTSIYGGTDQIQRNILAERMLGLPRDATG